MLTSTAGYRPEAGCAERAMEQLAMLKFKCSKAGGTRLMTAFLPWLGKHRGRWHLVSQSQFLYSIKIP